MSKMIITLPFPVKQLTEKSFEVNLGEPMPVFIVDNLSKAYPWLSDEEIDKMMGETYQTMAESAVKSAVRISYK